MESDVVLPLGVLTLITLVVVVVIWQVFSTYKARVAVSREEAYRRLVEQMASAQRETADHLGRIARDLDALKDRMTVLERILQEVE